MKRGHLAFASKETVIPFVISYQEIKKENAEKIVEQTLKALFLKNVKLVLREAVVKIWL